MKFIMQFLFFVCVMPGGVFAADDAAVQRKLKAVTGYTLDQSRKPLVEVESLVHRAAADEGLRKQLAAAMTGMLASDATKDCKRFLCEQLSLIATDSEVKVLERYLSDEALSRSAREALSRIGTDAAYAALLRGMKHGKGDALIGFVNTLGEHRKADAVNALAPHLKSDNRVLVAAVLKALGKIGGADAVAALMASGGDIPLALFPLRRDALLCCADQFLAQGKREHALPLYREFSRKDQPAHILCAVLSGYLSCLDRKEACLMISAVLNGDTPLHKKAVYRSLSDSATAEVIADLCERIDSFSASVQEQLIDALGFRREPDVVAELIEFVSHKKRAVRIAALNAVARSGTLECCPDLCPLLTQKKDAAELLALEHAILSVCSRAGDKQKAVDCLHECMKKAPPASKTAFLPVLGAVGTEKAVRIVTGAFENGSTPVRHAAFRVLCERSGRPAGELFGMLKTMLRKAETVSEKRPLIALLPRFETVPALKFTLTFLDDPALSQCAAQSACSIGKALMDTDKQAVEQAMKKILKASDDDMVRQTAYTVFLDAQTNLAMKAKADSPDGHASDGTASGDQAAIDNNMATYWDEVDGKKEYQLQLRFQSGVEISVLSIHGYEHHNYAPKDFEVICDGSVVKTVANAEYRSNKLVVAVPKTKCRTLLLRITGYYGRSPAIRELGVYDFELPGNNR